MIIPLQILFFVIGAFIMFLFLLGIQYLYERNQKVTASMATPKPMLMGVKDGEH